MIDQAQLDEIVAMAKARPWVSLDSAIVLELCEKARGLIAESGNPDSDPEALGYEIELRAWPFHL